MGLFGFDVGFGILQGLFFLAFAVFLVFFIITAAKGIGTWHKNNNSPRLTVEATVVAKRQNTEVHHHPNGGDATGAHGMHTTTSTTYYVTFQVASGDRMEMTVKGQVYGMLAEGDMGKLTFQGTRYLDFERQGSKTFDSDPEQGRASWDPER